jgi:hypothetical protein
MNNDFGGNPAHEDEQRFQQQGTLRINEQRFQQQRPCASMNNVFSRNPAHQ